MKGRTMLTRKNLSLTGILLAACLTFIVAPVCAQEAKPAAKEAAKKAPAKPRGRLPAYYSQVVTPQQREQIYTLQKPIIEKIEALEAQITELKAQLEKESRAVLTAEQIKKIEELTAATQEKIKAARQGGAAKQDDSAAAPAKPAATATPKK